MAYPIQDTPNLTGDDAKYFREVQKKMAERRKDPEFIEEMKKWKEEGRRLREIFEAKGQL